VLSAAGIGDRGYYGRVEDIRADIEDTLVASYGIGACEHECRHSFVVLLTVERALKFISTVVSGACAALHRYFRVWLCVMAALRAETS
jgi:hypothetical protein